ncbi:MAG TPA: hypothetical protein VMG36_08375 [Thermoplasmata archaeon]|nr:hypothetical protein [Thermoplasmata archaeon]
MRPAPGVAWLLDPEQPAVRCRTLTELLDRPASDPEVAAARRAIVRKGWVREILDAQVPGGGWDVGPSSYVPKYLATNWRMLVLSDLGVDRSMPEIAALCERWMAAFPLAGGGVGGNSKGTGHHCVVGNLARGLCRMGYGDDPRVRRSMEWLVETASPLGGWSCFGSGRNLDSWEGLSAFAAYPRERWTAEMTAVVGKAAEFFLERELHRQGGRYAPWYRLHYPVHYYYDLLVGLEILTALGYGSDPRLGVAHRWLLGKRRADGRWPLDAVHPDAGATMARWYRAHPRDRPTPWALEPVGAPSRMVTLRALTVLRRLAPSVPGRRRNVKPARPSHRPGRS